MVVMLALVAGIASIPVLAASNGIYTATATSHYKHPTTGIIEDSGGEGSYVLGQSMTDSALNKAALVEVDSQGNAYVTVRLNLMDNIQDPQFQVDGSRNGDFSSVSATVMQEDFTNNTTDFRMQVPSESAIIRCNMYVIPMGRDVVFYITVGDLKSGSGDFVTSVKVEEPAQEPDTQPEQSTISTPATQAPATQTSATQAPSTQTPAAQTPATDTSGGQTPSSETPASDAPSSAHATSSGPTASTSCVEEEETVAGLAEFDAYGNAVSDPSTQTRDNGGSTGNPVIWWVIGGIIVIAVAGGCVWYLGFFRRKKRG